MDWVESIHRAIRYMEDHLREELTIRDIAQQAEPLPVKRTVKKYKVFLASSQALLATFYAAKHNSCFSIGVNTPKLRCTLLVL